MIRASIRACIAAAARECDVRPSDIIGASRSRPLITPRHVACYVASRHFGHSMPRIGLIMHRDHSTVLHAIRSIGEKIQTDDKLAALVDMVSQRARLGLACARNDNDPVPEPPAPAAAVIELPLPMWGVDGEEDYLAAMAASAEKSTARTAMWRG